MIDDGARVIIAVASARLMWQPMLVHDFDAYGILLLGAVSLGE